MGIKGQKWIEKLSKAEKFVRENPNADWEEILNNMIFVEERDDEEFYKLTLEEESTDVIIRDSYTDIISLSVIFDDDSCIDLSEICSSYDHYYKVDSIWESKDIVNSRKEVYYVKRQDIVIYTD